MIEAESSEWWTLCCFGCVMTEVFGSKPQSELIKVYNVGLVMWNLVVNLSMKCWDFFYQVICQCVFLWTDKVLNNAYVYQLHAFNCNFSNWLYFGYILQQHGWCSPIFRASKFCYFLNSRITSFHQRYTSDNSFFFW